MGFFQFGSLFIFVGQKLTKMTKADIVKQLAQETGVEAVTVLAVVEGFMEEVRAAQIRKENVFLRGFGTFLIKHRKEKTARNITKNTTIKIPAHDLSLLPPSSGFWKRNDCHNAPIRMFESGRCRFIAAGDPSGIQACMVCEELLQPAVRQRMSEQPFDCRKGACRHIGTRIETLDNMLRMTDRSGQHLRFVTIGAVDLHDVGYQCHAVFGDVVETSHERRHIGRSGLCRQQRLPHGEYQRAVRPDILRREVFYGPYSCGRAGQFHDDAGMQCRQRLTLSHHSFEVGGYDLGAHVPFDDVADFNVMTVAVLRTPDVLFGHQRRIGRYAVQNAQFMRLANLLQIGCVDEEFHGSIGFRFP